MEGIREVIGHSRTSGAPGLEGGVGEAERDVGPEEVAGSWQRRSQHHRPSTQRVAQQSPTSRGPVMLPSFTNQANHCCPKMEFCRVAYLKPTQATSTTCIIIRKFRFFFFYSFFCLNLIFCVSPVHAIINQVRKNCLTGE